MFIYFLNVLIARIMKWLFRLVIPALADLIRDGLLWMLSAILDYLKDDPIADEPEFFVTVPKHLVSDKEEDVHVHENSAFGPSEWGTPFPS